MMMMMTNYLLLRKHWATRALRFEQSPATELASSDGNGS